MDKNEITKSALNRATLNGSTSNFPAIFQGFIDKGLPIDDIKPRVNIFTYNAWIAKGRHVRKNEHGVKIPVWVVVKQKVSDNHTGEQKTASFKRKKSTTVFHVSQTDNL